MHTFESMGLDPKILIALEELGFESPTPIQERTIPALLDGRRELIALAQTGTGKTAAFGLPLIHLMDPETDEVQALVLAPTRELCLQIAKDLEIFARHMGNVDVLAVYGGAEIRSQITRLKKNPTIVVGTPGRTLDLIRRGNLKLDGLRYWVLDEADEMLNLGFREELDAIEAATPREKCILLFSATMPPETSEIARIYMKAPETISVVQKNVSAANVSHQYCLVRNSDRYLAVKRIADFFPDIYGIVFCRTRVETKDVAERLIREGYNADALHGDLSQVQRDQVMGRFRDRSLQLLVATDVAARGLDVSDLTHVIHYNLPDETEVYIHRSGRTGRAGKFGSSIALLNQRDLRRLSALERQTGKEFKQMAIPSATEVVEARLFQLVESVRDMDNNIPELEDYIPAIDVELAELSREELIRNFFSFQFQQLFNYYKKADDLNFKPEKREKRRSSRDEENWVGLKLNAGFHEGMNASRLIGVVNDATNNRDITFGKIRILKGRSIFEVPAQYVNEVNDALNGYDFDGVELEVSPDRGAPRKSGYRSGDRGSNKGGKFYKTAAKPHRKGGKAKRKF